MSTPPIEGKEIVNTTYEEFKEKWVPELAPFSPMRIEAMLKECSISDEDATFITADKIIVVSKESIKAKFDEASKIIENSGASFHEDIPVGEKRPERVLDELSSMAGSPSQPSAEKGASVPAITIETFKKRAREASVKADGK